MQELPVEYRLDNGVATITLNRPDKRNALNRATVDALTDAVARAERDEVVAIIVAGAGPVFCAGADLAYLQQLQEFSIEENVDDSRALATALMALRSTPIPVIARVHGHAIAGGCGLATVCDIVYAVDGIKFGYTEVGIGFIPAIVTAFLLQRAPQSGTRELLLSGRIIESGEAARRGIVTEVFGDEKGLDEAIDSLCKRMRGADRGAILMTKEMIGTMEGMTLESALEYGVRMNAFARTRPECQAGIAAFLEKRG